MTNRPVVGTTLVNEYYLDYQNKPVKKFISTFVHEVLHALFFLGDSFRKYPRNSKGETFMFQDTIFKMRGDNILREVRDHFNCPSLTAGTTDPTSNAQSR